MARSNRSPWQQGRKPARKRPARRILILCEDTKSARDYFEAFPHAADQVEIQCVGTGMSTDDLMEDAIRRAATARRERSPYEGIWVVFDRDLSPTSPDRKFNRAFDLADSHNNITACWSNDAFELWYLLHFNYHNSPIHRHQINRKLGELLGTKYQKADASLYQLLRPHLDTALRNAQKLEDANSGIPTLRGNPSTHVHHLVRALLALDPSEQNAPVSESTPQPPASGLASA